MTSAYQELTSKYEETLKKIRHGIDRSIYFNIVFATLWILLAFSVNDIASRYSLLASFAILIGDIASRYSLLVSFAILLLAIWRFSYFTSERKLDEELSNIVLEGFEYEKKHPQKKSNLFTEALDNFRRVHEIITRLVLLYFLINSFEIAFFGYWMKINIPSHQKMALLAFRLFEFALYVWLWKSVAKPFEKIKALELT